MSDVPKTGNLNDFIPIGKSDMNKKDQFRFQMENEKKNMHAQRQQGDNKQSKTGAEFIQKRMQTFSQGHMHSRVKGSGPVVTNAKQAEAIAYSEARKKHMKV